MPSATNVMKVMDAALRPHGFRRKNKTWTRRIGEVHHVIDVQVSKSADSATINVGVFDPAVHEVCWGEPAKSIQEPYAVLRSRIGYLLGDRDMWWSLDDSENAVLMAKASLEAAMPLLERISDRNALPTQMTVGQAAPSDKLRSIQVAILVAFDGRLEEANDQLEKIESNGGHWAARAAEVRGRLIAKFR